MNYINLKRLTRIIFSSSNRRVWLCRCWNDNEYIFFIRRILIVLSPNAMKLIIKMSVNLLSKLKLFKTLNEKLNIINKFIDEYSYSINLFVKNNTTLYIFYCNTKGKGGIFSVS